MTETVTSYTRLHTLVMAGEMAPGTRLVEIPLAERLGVSRPTIREALRRLEGRGLAVSDGRSLRVAGLDDGQLRSALLMRSALEGLHAGLAARRVAQGDVAPSQLRGLITIADTCERATNAGDVASAMVTNRAFHQGIDAMADSPLSAEAVEQVWDRIVIAAERSLVPAGRTSVVSAEHRELVDAIADGDSGLAIEVARRHVLATLDAQAGQ